MGPTDKRRNKLGMVWLIAAVPGIPAIISAEFPASTNAQQKYFSLLRIVEAEEILPQFFIQEKPFSIIVHKQRLEWPPEARHKIDPDDDETARSFEVRDATGASVYKQKIEDPAGEAELAQIRKEGRFAFTEAVYASRMLGAGNQALVVGWSSLPSAPDSCGTYVVLGLFDGKLVPFSEPFCEDIASPGLDSPERAWKLKRDPETGFENFEIRRSYGFFHVLVPIRVDFVMAKLLPARWCVNMGEPAPLAECCEFPVEANRIPANEDTFVRLFPSPDEAGTPRHVIVKPDSRIEFLAALAPNAMDRSGKWKEVRIDEIPWLKVLVDGKEGWVHAAEDLNALGLYQAG